MYFSQTVPAVRHAATALALLHRSYLDGDFTSTNLARGAQAPSFIKERQIVQDTALFHYTRAIQLLLSKSTAHRGNDKIVTVLLACYLFISFGHLAGCDVQAMQHLQSGVQLSRTLMKELGLEGGLSGQIISSDSHTFISQVASQIRRLDMQAVMFLTDWTPVGVRPASSVHIPRSCDLFLSVHEAADNLLPLLARAMDLFNTEHLYPENHAEPVYLQATYILLDMQSWMSRFEPMLQLQNCNPNLGDATPDTYPLATLLHVQYIVGTILLQCLVPDREIKYDLFKPQFEQCVVLAKSVMVAYEQHSDSMKPTFTPEVGILPVLYMIGAKCRNPQIRREVVKILRRRLIREAVWNSKFAAKVIERIIDIEENGMDADSSPRHNSSQILAWHRIETVSWTLVSSTQATDTLDVRYIFNNRRAAHTETVVV